MSLRDRAALRAVGPGDAEVRDPRKPHVVDRADIPLRRTGRRDIEHHRPVAQVNENDEVHRVAVRRQNSDAKSISSEKIRIELSPTPDRRNPSCMATDDAPG